MAKPIDPTTALELVLAAVPTPSVATLPAEDCLGLVLAADATAAGDLPPFDRAMMDGYAVRLADAGRSVAILDEIAAGDGRTRPTLADGAAHPIMTGAPVPAGAEAVVPFEQSERNGDRVRLPERLRAAANIVARGAECRAGTPWARAGQTVTPLTVAAAIGVGALQLTVHPRPHIAVLATGSELSADPGAGCIRDSNGPMLAALLREAGLAAERLTVGDEAAALLARLRACAGHDAIVLTGGVSAGTHDEVPGALRQLGAEVLFHSVAQKPGKPLLVARLGRQLIFALPGNPLASHLCCCRYVLPALRQLAGLPAVATSGRGVLAAPLAGNGDRIWFVPVLVHGDAVTPLPPVSSADLVQPHQANAYLRLEPGVAAQPAGATVAYTRIGANAWR